MLDPTHKALIVRVNRHRVTDVYVGVGPNFGIGEDHPDPRVGTRLLLAEVKTSNVDLTDRAIWHAATAKHEWVIGRDSESFGVVEWVRRYEELNVPPDKCVVWGV